MTKIGAEINGELLLVYQIQAQLNIASPWVLLTASAVLGALDHEKVLYNERTPIPTITLSLYLVSRQPDNLIDGATYPTEDEKLKAKERYL